MSGFTYPKVERGNDVEEIFGKQVHDEYRWLEDPDSERTNEFIAQQNAITFPYLEKCSYRDRLRKLLTSSQDYVRFGSPFKRGDKYYFFCNSGLQPQAVVFQQDSLDSEPKVFFDPNTLSDDGTIALNMHSFSPNGKYFAYGISYGGSDWIEIGVMDVETKKDIGERLTGIKFSTIEWTHDNKGFFFSMFPGVEVIKGKCKETDSHSSHSIFYHFIGSSQKDIIFKYSFSHDPKRLTVSHVSDDGKILHVYLRKGVNDREWFYAELEYPINKSKLELKPIFEGDIDAEFDYITNNGDDVYFKTNLDAPNYRVAKLNIKNPSSDTWVDIVPNHHTDVLEWAEVYTVDGRDLMLVKYTKNVSSELEIRDLEGNLVKEIKHTPGTIQKMSARRQDDEIFYQFTSFLTPGQNYHLDLRRLDQEPKLLRESKPDGFEPNDYTIDQVFYKSKDQTQIPMFIIHRKDMIKDGSNPCILYGYGGFNIQVTNSFNINRIVWINNFKGILAIANIRGGGEFGRNWHNSGRLLKKQNVFDDFICAAEYLIDNKYTQTKKLAIEGGSNGGLLVTAVSNQRPDLFGAMVCRVGLLDMIRYPKFTIGHAWITEYGDPKSKDDFLNLINYSPYHNIPESGVYPATLLLTADRDDRVVPAHSLKFIAQLQHKLGAKIPETPLLIRVDTKAGHGLGKPTAKIIDEFADIYAFLSNVFHLEKNYVD